MTRTPPAEFTMAASSPASLRFSWSLFPYSSPLEVEVICLPHATGGQGSDMGETGKNRVLAQIL